MIKSREQTDDELLRATVDRLLPSVEHALPLLKRFLSRSEYDRNYAHNLTRMGRGDEPWAIRRLAALMLESQLWAIPPDDLAEHVLWFRELGLMAAGSPERLSAEVLVEGYSTRALPDFIAQFRDRIGRRRWLHLERPATLEQITRFVLASRSEGLLTLARYLFSPGDVVARVNELLDRSAAGPSMLAILPSVVSEEARRTLDGLPSYEREVTEALLAEPGACWVTSAITSDPRALVERPELSAALAIALPGSNIELELKRAGVSGPRPLDIIYRKPSGEVAPREHRLWGASSASLLRFEAKAGARFARLYRLIHGHDASMARVLDISSIDELPHAPGRHLASHFADEREYGPGFSAMWAAMLDGIADERDEESSLGQGRRGCEGSQRLDDQRSSPTTATGWVTRFLSRHAPAQALLCGTSALRLNLLVGAIGDPMPRTQAAQDELARCEEAREISWASRRADMLDEALGGLPIGTIDVRGELDIADVVALMSTPDVRRRADRVYRELLAQLGELWATYVALRAHSHGESFVARNLGVRSVWQRGRWAVQLISMDHDRLYVCRPDSREMDIDELLRGSLGDAAFFWNSAACLECIYHVDDETIQAAQRELWPTLGRSYRHVRDVVAASDGFDGEIQPAFIRWSGDLEALARCFVDAGERWRDPCAALLVDRGWTTGDVERTLDAVAACPQSLEQLARFAAAR